MSSAVNPFLPPAIARPGWLTILWFRSPDTVLCAGAGQTRPPVGNRRGHGARLLRPVVAAFIAWQKRDEFFARPCARTTGAARGPYAGLQLMVSQLGAELFLARIAFILSVVGSILLVGGTKAVRLLLSRDPAALHGADSCHHLRPDHASPATDRQQLPSRRCHRHTGTT